MASLAAVREKVNAYALALVYCWRMMLTSSRFILAVQSGRAAIENERERWAYWVPVLFGCGIGGYFSLSAEPPLGPVVALWLLSLLAALRGRGQAGLRIVLIAVLALVTGFAAAKLRTALLDTVMLDRALSPVVVEGIITSRETTTNGHRLLLQQVIYPERAAGRRLPQQIRLSVRDALLPEAMEVGARIKALVNLLPVSEPFYPGGYDFRRQLYFEGTGATGIVLTRIEILNPSEIPVSGAEFWRNSLAGQISQTLGGAEAAIAIALMTGERGAIDEVSNEDMRRAGTSHLLSISGMHIGMVGGFVFFLVRSLLALIPFLALRYPARKIAAVCALLAVVTYTGLVGAPIPAQRSMVMAGLVFVAIVLDRIALSMRTVALAAGVIVLLFPESLLNPGFQMSFAAIVMLIAAYEWWSIRRGDEFAQKAGWLEKAGRYVAGIIITSLIAGIATAPFGAWHFHRFQIYGVLGNLIAVPLTGFVVMPAVVLAYLLLPIGLGELPLWALGWGLHLVLESAAWISDFSMSDITVAQFPLVALVVMALGGLWLAIWQERLRFLGGGVILLGLAMSFTGQQPIAVVSAEGKIAVRGADSHLYYPAMPRGLLAKDWGRAFDGAQAPKLWSDLQSGVRCDRLGCVSPQGFAMPRRPESLTDDCQLARLIIAPEWSIRYCTASYIDRLALRRHGAHAIMNDGTVVASRQGSFRPWHPGYSAR